MNTTGCELGCGELAEATDERTGERHELRARARVDSGINLHDPWTVARLGFEGDEEPTAADVERQRAYADWLARFEPRKKGRRQREHAVRLVADQIDAGSGERAA
jgi:hypothetical protein